MKKIERDARKLLDEIGRLSRKHYNKLSDPLEKILSRIKKGKIKYSKDARCKKDEIRLYELETLYVGYERCVSFILAKNLYEVLNLFKSYTKDYREHELKGIREYPIRQSGFIDQLLLD